MPCISQTTIVKALAGDTVAFQRIYDSLYNYLVIYVTTITKNREEAKDIVQDTFIKIYQNIHAYEETGSFTAWAKQIARNTALNMLKGKQRFYRLLEQKKERIRDSDASSQSTILEHFMHEDMEHDILQNLSINERMSLLLYAVNGLSYKEIAQQLDISVDAVKSRLRSARKKAKNR